MSKRNTSKHEQNKKKHPVKHVRSDILTPIGKKLWDDTDSNVSDMDEILNCPIIPGKTGVES